MVPYQILEVANCHGGNIDYLLSLIDEFGFIKRVGMKFQPLHPDKIATKDYEWHNVYQQLYFDFSQWKVIIENASKTKDIWLDLFDDYGVDIYEENREKVKGIKLQASVLYNEGIINELEKVGIFGKILIINISALDIDEIRNRLDFFNSKLRPLEIWIEVGFQAYPTEINDSGIVKINILKKHFANKVVFADHLDGKSDDSIWLPIFAVMSGADIIEKHIMHSKFETRFDHFSSINFEKYNNFIDALSRYAKSQNQPFINDRERSYLKNSIQIPISKLPIVSGSIIKTSSQLEFKRSGQVGLSTKEIIDLQKLYYILNTDIEKHQTFKQENFKKAVIATIVACRMKSTRLIRKSLEKIGDITSVERCLQSCLNFSNTHFTILATSDLEDDQILKNYIYSPSVIFHNGDPEDVISRYLGIIDVLRIDVVIRVTADMPFVSNTIVEYLLKSHFESGADYTVAKTSAVGTSAEIFNANCLRKIKKHFPSADYSEYMTWYFQNNPEHFKLNFVELPENLVRNYRLTLDYQEDLDLFVAIQKHIDETKKPNNIETIFEYLDTNPDIAAINSHIQLKYKSDKDLIALLDKETKIK